MVDGPRIRHRRTHMEKLKVCELASESRVPYLLTAAQVCEVFQISRMQLWRLETQKGLKSVKVGKRMKRYAIPDLEEYISANP